MKPLLGLETAADRCAADQSFANDVAENEAFQKMDAFNEGFHARRAFGDAARPSETIRRRHELVMQWHRGKVCADLIQVMWSCDCGEEDRCFQPDATPPTCMRKALQDKLFAAVDCARRQQ